MAKRFVLILGGARSGKSTFAQGLAQSLGEKVLFVATGEPLDEEMALRIEEHKRNRPESWRTLEIGVNVGQSLKREMGDAEVVLLDCLTLLVSNIILKPLSFGSGEGEMEDNYPCNLKASPTRPSAPSDFYHSEPFAPCHSEGENLPKNLAQDKHREATSKAEIQVMTELEQLIDFIDKYNGTFIVVSNEVGLGLVPENKLGRVYRDLLGKANQLLARRADEVYFMAAGIPAKIKG
jgi:adenosylcobinamide kinase / adenosylcobinamide-phosphate guanylyltransferase